MRGFPKHLNTRQDVDNVLQSHPEQARQRLQAMVDERFNWFYDGELADGEAGVTDDTHKVETFEDETTGEVRRYQMELREDPNATLFRLGLTVAEAESLIQGGS